MTLWRVRTYLILAVVAILASAVPGRGEELMTNVKVGDRAPDFTLSDQNNKPVKLSDFRGKKNVVLAFYVLAFTAG